jgi:hypothetical protein
MEILKKNWLSIVVICICLFFILTGQHKSELLLKEIKHLEKLNEGLEQRSEDLSFTIDSLMSLDPIIVKEIDSIKIETDEKIIVIDTMSTSSLQKFFSDRYN